MDLEVANITQPPVLSPTMIYTFLYMIFGKFFSIYKQVETSRSYTIYNLILIENVIELMARRRPIRT